MLVGASMGGIAVLRYAASIDDPESLAGVVTVSCPAEWRLPRNARGVFAAALTRTPPGRALTSRLMRVQVAPRWTNPEPPIDLVPRITCPVAIIHGTADRFVAPAAAAELHRVANSPRRLDLVPGLGHAFEPESIPAVRDAVTWALAQ